MPLYKQKLILFLSSLFLFAACYGKKSSPITELLKNERAAVFVFLAPDCPLSQSYTLTLNSLYMRFQPSDVAFHGVFSGTSSDKRAVDDFVSTYKIQFPVLLDPDLALADFFGATKTPEVFVVNPQGGVFYKGAIDNGSPELGQHRSVVTEHYVQDALDSLLQHRTVKVNETKAVGCFIERRGG